MKGLELIREFEKEAVRPILESRFPSLQYATARLGTGSDVLGYDDTTSRDHDWSLQLTLFLDPATFERDQTHIQDAFAEDLPLTYKGFSTRYSKHEDGSADFSLQGDPVHHGISITTLHQFFTSYLGIVPDQRLVAQDWLSLPSQKLRTIASGAVFHDGLGELETIRETLAWYPHDIWLHLMANQWRKIDQEEPFVGRCGDADDEIGSRIIATRQIVELMRLCFLIERVHAPYSKWFGTAFTELACAKTLTPLLTAVLDSQDWQTRERHLSAAYEAVGHMHNDLKITPEVEVRISAFHTRPYQVPHSDRFVDALHDAITSEEVAALPRHVGAIWQYADSTDILTRTHRCRNISTASLREHPS